MISQTPMFGKCHCDWQAGESIPFLPPRENTQFCSVGCQPYTAEALLGIWALKLSTIRWTLSASLSCHAGVQPISNYLLFLPSCLFYSGQKLTCPRCEISLCNDIFKPSMAHNCATYWDSFFSTDTRVLWHFPDLKEPSFVDVQPSAIINRPFHWTANKQHDFG